MQRVITYIDGFNLYFGLRAKKWHRYYWLDLVALSKTLLKPDQQLISTHYFTARVRSSGQHQQDARRQSIYLDALATLSDMTIHEGHYLEKPRQCQQCGATWMSYEEKMTDVNIATQLLSDAFDNRFDAALIISADSDLTTPVRKVRERFPGKRVIIALPPERRSHQLTQAANGFVAIGEDKLRKSQLPDQIASVSGFMLQRPPNWR